MAARYGARPPERRARRGAAGPLANGAPAHGCAQHPTRARARSALGPALAVARGLRTSAAERRIVSFPAPAPGADQRHTSRPAARPARQRRASVDGHHAHGALCAAPARRSRSPPHLLCGAWRQLSLMSLAAAATTSVPHAATAAAALREARPPPPFADRVPCLHASTVSAGVRAPPDSAHLSIRVVPRPRRQRRSQSGLHSSSVTRPFSVAVLHGQAHSVFAVRAQARRGHAGLGSATGTHRAPRASCACPRHSVCKK